MSALMYDQLHPLSKPKETNTMKPALQWGLSVVAMLLLIAGVWWFQLVSQSPGSWTGNATVLDGDHLKIRDQLIRLEGMDAWEPAQGCPDATGELYPCGESATAFMQLLLKDETVTCTQTSRDRFKRPIASCEFSGNDIGSIMVRSGHAVVTWSKRYRQEELWAKKWRVGGWRGWPEQEPVLPKWWRWKHRDKVNPEHPYRAFQ
ncbi:MAG: thermonuclease family protein [Magnetococcales bacterium]|nr:thermonuclease family protein [Magnetococcales bacterium]